MFYLKGIGMVNLLTDIEDMREDLEEFEYQIAMVAKHLETSLSEQVAASGSGSERAGQGSNPYEVRGL